MLPLREHRKLERRAYATWALLVLLAVAYVLQMATSVAASRFGLVPSHMGGARIATLLSHVAVHASVLHLLGNLLFLGVFGPGVEDTLGRTRFMILFCSAGIAGGLAKWAVDASSVVPMVGASGAISGLLGAAVVLAPRSPVLTWVPYFIVVQLVEVPMFVFVVAWLGLQLTFAYLSIGGGIAVAPFAHLGGFLLGMGLAYALLPKNDHD